MSAGALASMDFKTVRTINDSLFRIPVKKKPLHRGAYGNVYIAYRWGDETCKYVAKVMKLRKPEERAHFTLESYLATRAGEQNYGPKVAECYVAQNSSQPKCAQGVIVMERWEGDMDERRMSKAEVRKILELVTKMHDDHVFHQDLYFRNILFRRNNVTKQREYCITDYGLAFAMQEVTPELRAADIVSLLYGEYEPSKNIYDFGVRRISINRDGLLLDDFGIDELRRELQFTPEVWLRGIQWKVYRHMAFQRTSGEESAGADCAAKYTMKRFSKKALKKISIIDGIQFYKHLMEHANKDIMKSMDPRSVQAKCAFSVYVTSDDEEAIDDMVEEYFANFVPNKN